jgi:hypothetical protein
MGIGLEQADECFGDDRRTDRAEAFALLAAAIDVGKPYDFGLGEDVEP